MVVRHLLRLRVLMGRGRSGQYCMVAEFAFKFVALLLDASQFVPHVLHFAYQLAVGDFQVVALLEPLGAAVLCVASVLQCASFLLEADHLIAWTAVQSLVEFPYGQGHE